MHFHYIMDVNWSIFRMYEFSHKHKKLCSLRPVLGVSVYVYMQISTGKFPLYINYVEGIVQLKLTGVKNKLKR